MPGKQKILTNNLAIYTQLKRERLSYFMVIRLATAHGLFFVPHDVDPNQAAYSPQYCWGEKSSSLPWLQHVSEAILLITVVCWMENGPIAKV